MDSAIATNCAKYFVLAFVIYVVLRVVTKTYCREISEQDIIIIDLIFVLIIASIEVAWRYFTDNRTGDNGDSCNCAREPFVGTNDVDEEQNGEYKLDPAITRNADGSYIIRPGRDPQTEAIGSRAKDGAMGDDEKYRFVDYNNFRMTGVSVNKFDPTYSIYPPSQWFPTPMHPPVCVSEKKCPVCPVYMGNAGSEMVELGEDWHENRRISPPDNINVAFTREKLNSGR